mmetsp:Transcript_3265/g.5920  ORF Transcript_3265/g.5920 Transcript_3265/m.5920 type:complete len:899 (-) Transcript_3265:81-2777(-)
MVWLPLRCLVWWSLNFILCQCTSRKTESDPRRLRGSRKFSAFERRLKVVSTDPDWVDARRLSPLLGLGNFKLKSVLAVDKQRPWILSHTEYSDQFHERRRLLEADHAENDVHEVVRRLSRRLSDSGEAALDAWALDFIQSEDFKEAIKAAFAFRTPRERLRVMAVLNAAALPEAALTNTTANLNNAQLVYQEENMGFSKNDTELNNNDSILSVNDGTKPEDVGANQSTINRAFRDGLALKAGRNGIRTYTDTDWQSDQFQGQRSASCADKTAEDERCFSDVGIAMSVYQNENFKMIIFHSDWSMYAKEYILWAYRAWILDSFEKQVEDQWTVDARQGITSEMNERRGTIFAERQERCAYKDGGYQPVPDKESFSKDQDLTLAELDTSGLWGIVKKLVRVILPAERDRVLELVRQNYLIGSGFGGVWAALTSMWLKKVDDAKYSTIIIAGMGWQCLSRELVAEMTPSDPHDQISVYAHIMDTYAKMDGVAGYVCMYGSTNFTEGDRVYDYCSSIVGFSGPQLWYRGASIPDHPTALEENIYQGSEQQSKVEYARKAFDACHYYTHSMYYTAILWLNDRILMPDGTTDAGCKTQEPVPAEDNLGQCPAAALVDQECLEIVPNVKKLPVFAMIVVAGGLGCMIICAGIVGWAMLQRIRNDFWVFGQDTKAARAHRLGIVEQILKPLGIKFTELKKKNKISHHRGQRAKIARERAKEARQRKFKADLKAQASAEDGPPEVTGWEDIKGKAPEVDEGGGGKGKGFGKGVGALGGISALGPLAKKAAAQSEKDRLLQPEAGVVGAASDKADQKKVKPIKKSAEESIPDKKTKRNSTRSAERGRPGSSTDPAPDNSSNAKLKVPPRAKSARPASPTPSPRGERKSVKFKSKSAEAKRPSTSSRSA